MCEHAILAGAAVVAGCTAHSRPAAGVRVWTWAPAPLPDPSPGCPCAVADRFVVAHESASARWLGAADVLLTEPHDRTCATATAPARLARLPGCALVVVPLVGGGVVVGGASGVVALPASRARVCAACLYPWLTGGGRLTDLPERAADPAGPRPGRGHPARG